MLLKSISAKLCPTVLGQAAMDCVVSLALIIGMTLHYILSGSSKLELLMEFILVLG